MDIIRGVGYKGAPIEVLFWASAIKPAPFSPGKQVFRISKDTESGKTGFFDKALREVISDLQETQSHIVCIPQVPVGSKRGPVKGIIRGNVGPGLSGVQASNRSREDRNCPITSGFWKASRSNSNRSTPVTKLNWVVRKKPL